VAQRVPGSYLRVMWSYKICYIITNYTDTWNRWKGKLVNLEQKARRRILATFMLAKINQRRLPT